MKKSYKGDFRLLGKKTFGNIMCEIIAEQGNAQAIMIHTIIGNERWFV